MNVALISSWVGSWTDDAPLGNCPVGRLAIGIATDICRYRFLSGPAFTLAVRISFRVGDHTDRAIGKNTSDFGQDMLAGSGTYKARFYVARPRPPSSGRITRKPERTVALQLTQGQV